MERMGAEDKRFPENGRIYEKRILLVDDNEKLCQMVTGFLQKEGFRNLRTAMSCRECLEQCEAEMPDIIILDVGLPDGDGFSLMNALRARSDVPVLFLSARDEDADRLLGLGLGADDYITKPFLPRELALRLTAVLKRTYPGQSPSARQENTLRLGNRTVDLAAGCVREAAPREPGAKGTDAALREPGAKGTGAALREPGAKGTDAALREPGAKGIGAVSTGISTARQEPGGREIESTARQEPGAQEVEDTAPQEPGEWKLTAKELLLLQKLCENRGRIVTFDALSQALWGDFYYGYENSLMVHVRRLREKIEENPSEPRWLTTARGLGYKLEKEPGARG